MRTGGQIVVDQLRLHGVKRIFGVPGESYLPILDALHDEHTLRYVTCRQEGGAAMMAEAWGKLTGTPGVCCVTRGPGATNASAGVHVAVQDSTPLLLLIGQVNTRFAGREAFQEIDYRQMFAGQAKWVASVDRVERLPELISRAFHTATAGRPGPVVLALPDDVLAARVAVSDPAPWQPSQAAPAPAALLRLARQLAAARRPLVVVGGGGWNHQACANLQRFAERFALPVVTSFRCQDYFDNENPGYAGTMGIGIDPRLAARIRGSDLLLVLGARLEEMATGGYTLIDIPRPQMFLAHVLPDGNELGRVYQADLPIVASMEAVTEALAGLPVPEGETGAWPWADQTRAAHREWETFRTPVPVAGPLQLPAVIAALAKAVPPDTIVCNGAGNYSAFLHRFYRWRSWRTQLAPTSGSMGYGPAAAVAAALCHPERLVLSLSGDGCFLMTGQELATAVQEGCRILYLVFDNGSYGTIRMHQERRYPHRPSGTRLLNPDFAAYARAFGLYAETVEQTEAFAPALSRVRQHLTHGPALLHLRLADTLMPPLPTQIDEGGIAGNTGR